MKRLDLTGQRFRRLIVIKLAYIKGHTYWKCICNCGNETIIRGSSLKNGSIQSCGCLRREKMFETNKNMNRNGKNNPNYIDGRTKERLNRTYHDMKKRCRSVGKYGMHGIFVCRLWRKSYIVFKNWALKNGYQENLTIDRINNGGPYGPWNCQWLTLSENASKGEKYYENRNSRRMVG